MKKIFFLFSFCAVLVACDKHQDNLLTRDNFIGKYQLSVSGDVTLNVMGISTPVPVDFAEIAMEIVADEANPDRVLLLIEDVDTLHGEIANSKLYVDNLNENMNVGEYFDEESAALIKQYLQIDITDAVMKIVVTHTPAMLSGDTLRCQSVVSSSLDGTLGTMMGMVGSLDEMAVRE